jgi:hypothetical protein
MLYATSLIIYDYGGTPKVEKLSLEHSADVDVGWTTDPVTWNYTGTETKRHYRWMSGPLRVRNEPDIFESELRRH